MSFKLSTGENMRHVENSVFCQYVKEREVEQCSCQHVSSLYYVSGNNKKYLPKNEAENTYFEENIFFSTI